MMSSDFERRDSRKRRRLSERRRVFSRIGPSSEQRILSGGGNGSLSTEQSWSSSSHYTHTNTLEDQQSRSNSRSDSPLGDNKISMKIQFHIIVAPDNEPLILDAGSPPASLSSARQEVASAASGEKNSIKKSIESIGEHIHERLLSRQNTASTRRRTQLLAMHNQWALDTANNATGSSRKSRVLDNNSSKLEQAIVHSDHNLAHMRRATAGELLSSEMVCSEVRESGVRSSTITDGMSDESTMEFLARHNGQRLGPQISATSGSTTTTTAAAAAVAAATATAALGGVKLADGHCEHIYFKRDGQRFGHEFTLKLAVGRTYRCLIKVRPLIPLQSISIHGEHVLFADCSQTSSIAAVAAAVSSASAPVSSTSLNRSWQSIHPNQQATQQQLQLPYAAAAIATTTSQHHQHRQRNLSSCSGDQHASRQQHHRLNHALTTNSINTAHGAIDAQLLARSLLYQQQQSQMLRHFAASSASSSNPHLGSQLIYMFDWSACRFEINKNKNRTQIQTVLKFKNGQILSLPLQIKFYQPECRQHLNWGSQLHFIDYDCSMNSMGQMNVDRIQYY